MSLNYETLNDEEVEGLNDEEHTFITKTMKGSS